MKDNNCKLSPTLEEIEEASRTPGGWVYRISGSFDHNDKIPPSAIVGAWKVDEEGQIIDDFIHNPNFVKEQ